MTTETRNLWQREYEPWRIGADGRLETPSATYLNALEARVEKLEAALREIVESTDPYHHLTSVNVARRALDDA